MKQKILVGMSGGVDSAVAVALLLRQGIEVTGATLKLWDGEMESGCCSLTDTEDARFVANHLQIPFYVLNFKELFRKTVVDPFVKSWMEGETPNPCLSCNEAVKFTGMLQKARAIGMDGVATGHYARTSFNGDTGRYCLHKGVDAGKDQSYVLYGLTQDQLAFTRFPLGGMYKTEVRALAQELGLSVSKKPDSQDICFVGEGRYADFVEVQSGQVALPGPFKDVHGQVLGTHRGLIHYTIGQRKHLGMSFGKRMAVISKDPMTNTVVVGEEPEVHFSGALIRQVNWVSMAVPTGSLRAAIRTRYHGDEAEATIHMMPEGLVQVEFDTRQRAITPGQAAVFYEGETVLGGGIIDKAIF